MHSLMNFTSLLMLGFILSSSYLNLISLGRAQDIPQPATP